MDTKEQVLYLLSSTSMGTVEIAQTLGVSPAVVSQLKGDPEFMQKVAERRTTVGLAQIRRDEKIDSLEDKALERMEKVLPLMFKPMEVLKAVQVINGLHRRSQQKEVLPGGTAEGNQVVSITLPKHTKEATVQVKFNTNNEIVEVEGRQMVNMPSGEVLKKLEEHKGSRQAPQISAPIDHAKVEAEEIYEDTFEAHLQLMQSF